jgi:hypothetical protein
MLEFSLSFVYGQNITIQQVVLGDVAGNGTAPNGVSPFTNDLDKNTITLEINGGTNGSVCGARNDANLTGDINGNNVNLNTRGTVTGGVYGGYSLGFGNVLGNQVFIDEATVSSGVYAGYSTSGDALNNTLIIAGGTITGRVLGGYVLQDGRVAGNRLEVRSGIMQDFAYGGRVEGSGIAENNTVEFIDGALAHDLIGGHVERDGKSTGNSVLIVGGMVGSSATANSGDVEAGYVEGSGDVANNILEIRGGTIFGDVVGGLVGSSGTCTGNIVKLSGGTIRGSIWGGALETGSGTVAYNTVEITGTPKFSTSTVIYGGQIGTTGEAVLGNTFTLKTRGIEVLDLINFENYNFYYPEDGDAESEMIKVANRVNFENTKILLCFDKNKSFNIGDKFTLITSTSGIINFSPDSLVVYQDVVTMYNCYSAVEGGKLSSTISNIYVNPDVKVISQSRAGSLAFLGYGPDFAAELQEFGEENKKINPFIICSGGKLRYDGDLCVDVTGANLSGGIVKYKELEKWGSMVRVGGFAEYGDGKYNLSNVTDDDVTSKGIVNYIGGGITGRIEIKRKVYIDVLGRVGKCGSDFVSEDLVDVVTKEKLTYNSNEMYLGGGVGSGYMLHFDKLDVNLGGVFMVTHRPQKDIVLSSTQYPLSFQGTSISKMGIEIQLRGIKLKGDVLKSHLGLGYEQEIIGKIEGKARTLEIPSVNLTRASSVQTKFDIVWVLGRFCTDCGVRFCIGQKKDVSGMLNVKYLI